MAHRDTQGARLEGARVEGARVEGAMVGVRVRCHGSLTCKHQR